MKAAIRFRILYNRGGVSAGCYGGNVRMADLADSIQAIMNAQSAEEAFSSFCRIMREYGYEQVVYTLVTDHPSLGLKRQHGLATSYPEHWMKYYHEKNYLPVDPVVAGAMNFRVPFFWNDLKDNPAISQDHLYILDQADEAGVRDGACIPLYGGEKGELAGVGLARAEGESGTDYEFLARAQFLAVFFNEKYRSFLEKAERPELTDKEKDILSWAAEGKTDAEIAAIIGLSNNTVRWYWKKIFHKLGTQGRVYSVTKAVSLKLISPRLLLSEATEK